MLTLTLLKTYEYQGRTYGPGDHQFDPTNPDDVRVHHMLSRVVATEQAGSSRPSKDSKRKSKRFTLLANQEAKTDATEG